MKKKIILIAVILSSSIITNAWSLTEKEQTCLDYFNLTKKQYGKGQIYDNCKDVIDNDGNLIFEGIVDITSKHWAYKAFKYVVEDLGIMEPKTPTRFVGDKTITRYELAQTFYNTLKKLEKSSGKNLSLSENWTPIGIIDVNTANRDVVNSVVNTYGLMQLMPDSKFMGNREMTRYELAYDLNNYLMLLERKFGQSNFPERERLVELRDVSTQHWAYPAIKNIVDKYQIMDGYPKKVYGGDQKLTRYEVAALLRRFFYLIHTKILFLTPAKDFE